MSSNNYYWRAVRRIAERKGISITKARRLDWEKEANAERKRRSKAASGVYETRKPATPKPTTKRSGKVSSISSKRTRAIPKRIPGPSKPSKRKTIPPKRVKPELKLKEYERIRRMEVDEELFGEEGEDEFQEEWETDWEADFPELDALDNLDDFLDDFEYEDSDKYKEPS